MAKPKKKRKKDLWLYLSVGGLLLWLLLRRGAGKLACPISSVLQWADLARRFALKQKVISLAQTLAIIHDQSQGSPNQVYYLGGVWPRYGLMGVPIAWAQEVGFNGSASDLLVPEINLEYGIKILAAMEERVRQLFGWGPMSSEIPGISSSTYSWYLSGQTFLPSDANNPILQSANRLTGLHNCYWPIAVELLP